MDRKCAICSDNAAKRCGGCSKVSYCSREHQKEHWKTHKKECSFFSIEDTPEMGKGFVATRDIKPGTIILEEMPVAVAPGWGAKALLSEPSCVACGFVMSDQGRKRVCSKCKWPACSLECEKDPAHVYECQLFASANFKFPPIESPLKEILHSELFIMLIRVLLLKRRDPELYEQVVRLQSEYSERKLDFNSFRDVPGFLEFLEEPMACLKTLGLRMGLAELSKLQRIIRINNHSRMNTVEGETSREYRSLQLYVKSSRMNNSCIPNCRWVMSRRPEFRMRICTTTAVKKGEPLTISYETRQSEVGTKQRQERFQPGGGFICKCTRCTDPTELGTFMSGVVCSVCYAPDKQDTGYFLPRVPSDVSQRAVWECNGCARTAFLSDLFPVDSLAEEIATMVKYAEVQPRRIGIPKLMAFCEGMIDKYQGKVLHPNHWVIQEAARAVLNLAWSDIDSVDVARNERYVQLGEYLLGIQDIVSPGLSSARAFLQRDVALCLNHLAVKMFDQKDFQTAARHIERGLHLQKDLLKFCRNEFPGVHVLTVENIQEEMDDALEKLKECKILSGMKKAMGPLGSCGHTP